MTIRKPKQKYDAELVQRFSTHRIWHFMNVAKSQGKDEAVFYHPVGTKATANYKALFSLLNQMGIHVRPEAPEIGLGAGVGMVRLSGFQKAKLVTV